jgi:hypothetical protein
MYYGNFVSLPQAQFIITGNPYCYTNAAKLVNPAAKLVNVCTAYSDVVPNFGYVRYLIKLSVFGPHGVPKY